MSTSQRFTLFFGVIGFLASNASAQLSAPDFTLTGSIEGSKLNIEAVPSPGFHLNAEAPASGQAGSGPKTKPDEIRAEKATFSFSPAPTTEITIQAYICDTANTFCEAHAVKARFHDGKLEVSKGVASLSDEAHTPPAEISNQDANGFWVNQPELALKEAETKNLPLLIDFFGIWCPPCNELEEEVFPTPAFQTASAAFVKLRLDADKEVSWPLKEKFRIGGYPTIIFANSKAEEISRIVGYRPANEFVAEIHGAAKLQKTSLAELKAKASKGDRAAKDRLGLLSLDHEDFPDAVQWLTGTKIHTEALWQAKIGQLNAKPSATTDEKIKLYESSLKQDWNTPEGLERYGKLADLYDQSKNPEKKKTALLSEVKLARKLIDNPKLLSGHDATAADLWASIAEAEENLGDAALAKEAWKKAAEEFGKGVKDPKERGYQLELAYCLWKSGNTEGAEKIYAKLESFYPKEFTYFYAHASYLNEMKKWSDAEPIAEKALVYSYGDNRLRTVHLLARILNSKGEGGRALKLVEETLSSTNEPKDEGNRSRRYIKKLRDLESELTKKSS